MSDGPSTACVVALLLLLLTATGCTLGYRHTVLDDVETRDDGHSVQIRGQGDTTTLGFVADFRVFRFIMPVELVARRFAFTDDEGAVDEKFLLREHRMLRLDVPLLSFWDLDDGGVGYPGVMEQRRSIELWTSGAIEMRSDPEYWVDAGLMYYHYHGVGVRLFGGFGAVPFRATTTPPGSQFLRVFEGRANRWGFGVEITVMSGEYGLEIFEWLLDMDRRHRERTRRRRQ